MMEEPFLNIDDDEYLMPDQEEYRRENFYYVERRCENCGYENFLYVRKGNTINSVIKMILCKKCGCNSLL